ncbi:MAG: cupin domain-containing protein [Actinobacteria bacterium]|nr:cupin domain-containing protein [Actinomycetota bacterium]
MVGEHSHDHEQLGIVLRGSLRFRVGEEERELPPGGTWSISSDVPHSATAGPDGASVIDVFARPSTTGRRSSGRSRGQGAGPDRGSSSSGARSAADRAEVIRRHPVGDVRPDQRAVDVGAEEVDPRPDTGVDDLVPRLRQARVGAR